MENKVVLIGCGNVGMAYAYSLMNQKTRVDNLRTSYSNLLMVP